METTSGLPIMEKSQTLGRISVAISLVVFGVQHFLYGGFVAGVGAAGVGWPLFWEVVFGGGRLPGAGGVHCRVIVRHAAIHVGRGVFFFVVVLPFPPDGLEL